MEDAITCDGRRAARLPSKETREAADPSGDNSKTFPATALPNVNSALAGQRGSSKLFHSPEREVAYLFPHLPRP